MRLSRQEIKDLNIDVTAWTRQMQAATRDGSSPHFALSGPAQLVVRKRPTRSGAVSTVSGRMSFSGGERFNLASVSLSKVGSEGMVQIDVSFTPIGMELIAAISGMSMPLSEAIELFDGFEDWVSSIRDELPSVVASKPKPKSLAQQHSDNPLWGSW